MQNFLSLKRQTIIFTKQIHEGRGAKPEAESSS